METLISGPTLDKRGARWYGMGSTHCHDCGGDDIDVDFAFYLREQYKDYKRSRRKLQQPVVPFKEWKAGYPHAPL